MILDNDKGIKEFKVMISNGTKIREQSGFELYKVGKNAFILLLPQNSSVEYLFNEFDDTLEECVRSVFTEDYALRDSIPLNLTRAASAARRHVDNVRSMDDAKEILGNQQDIKDVFWKEVADRDLKISAPSAEAIKAIIELTN